MTNVSICRTDGGISGGHPIITHSEATKSEMPRHRGSQQQQLQLMLLRSVATVFSACHASSLVEALCDNDLDQVAVFSLAIHC